MYKNLFSLLFLALLLTFTSCTDAKKEQAKVLRVEGDAYVLRAQDKIDAKEGMSLFEGDKVETMKDAAVILSFSSGFAKMEIQENALFNVGDYSSKEKTLSVLRGNVWTTVKKLNRDERVYLRTPTQHAAVRGTKFYTFKFGDIEGVCHCQGEVDYENMKSGYEKGHESDYFVITKGEKTILLTAEDFIRAGIELVHDHSVLEGSVLGNKVNVSTIPRMLEFINSKF